MISLTSPVETRAHRWPAGAKLLGLAVATVVLFSLEDTVILLGAFLCTAFAYALPGRVFFLSGCARLRSLWPFVLLISLWHGITGDIELGFGLVLRMVTAVALANLVTMTTRLTDMMQVVDVLLRPLAWCGVRTDVLTLSMGLVVRFTPQLAQKGTALTEAWRARAVSRPGWRIILPFAVAAIDDAERVADALKARGGL